ncbi:hypothetical protein SVIOM342S_10024 [Streptomyces violaceorubidus]
MVLLGRPAESGSQLLPASEVRKTRHLWSAGTRSASALIGKTYAVSPRCGWAATAKPNVEGRPSPMSVQCAPASSLRYTPQ